MLPLAVEGEEKFVEGDQFLLECLWWWRGEGGMGGVGEMPVVRKWVKQWVGGGG